MNSPSKIALQGEILFEFPKLVHSFDRSIDYSLLLKDQIVQVVSLIDQELVVIVMHLAPLLVDDLLADSCRFNTLPSFLHLLVYPLVVLGHNLLQLFVTVLAQECSG